MAKINPGIISTCMSIQTPLNCILGYFYWSEKLTLKMIIGTVVVLSGVIWISLDRGAQTVLTADEEEEGQYYKWISILCSLVGGSFTATRIFQAKYVSLHYKYSPVDFSIDSGLVIGVALTISACYFYLTDCATYTWRNYTICIFSSHLQMLTSLVGLNCTVKGLAGPTSAIFQAQSLVSIVLNIVFFGMVPTLNQILAAILTVSGVLMIIFSK